MATDTSQEWSRSCDYCFHEKQHLHSPVSSNMSADESCNGIPDLETKIDNILQPIRNVIYQQQYSQREHEQDGNGSLNFDTEIKIGPDGIKVHIFPLSDGEKHKWVCAYLSSTLLSAAGSFDHVFWKQLF